MLENDVGADFLPMRLVAVMVIVLILLASAAAYASDITSQSSKAAARAGIARIAAVASVEYAEDCPDSGDATQLGLSVPAIVRTIVIGAASSDASGEGAMGACHIHYVDGSCETYYAGLPLGSGDPAGKGGPIVLFPGRYTIDICVEILDGRPMAMIYAEAV